MIRVAVCDDERKICEELSGYLQELQTEVEEKLEIHCFQSAEEIRQEMEEDWYHIFFMDIRLGKYEQGKDGQEGNGEGTGIDTAKYIREKCPASQIIFITGYDQYVYDCFVVQPVDFIRKPLQPKKVEEAFRRALKQCDAMPIWEYTWEKTLHRVPLAEICFFFSDRRKVSIQVGTEEQIYYGRLDEEEKRLQRYSANFVRISKSVIINMHYVREISYDKVKLECRGCSWEFTISQAYRSSVREYRKERWKT